MTYNPYKSDQDDIAIKRIVRPNPIPPTTDFRLAILRTLKNQRLSKYWLGSQMIDRGFYTTRQPVYRYLAGTHDVGSEIVMAMLEELSLVIQNDTGI